MSLLSGPGCPVPVEGAAQRRGCWPRAPGGRARGPRGRGSTLLGVTGRNRFPLFTARSSAWALVRGGAHERACRGTGQDSEVLPPRLSPGLTSDVSHSLPPLTGSRQPSLLGADSGSALLSMSLAFAELKDEASDFPDVELRGARERPGSAATSPGCSPRPFLCPDCPTSFRVRISLVSQGTA